MAENERYPRTRKQVKNTKESKDKGKKWKSEEKGNSLETRVIWNVDQPSTDLLYEELEVEELKWPDEETRDSSQDQLKVLMIHKPNSRSKQLQNVQPVNCDSCSSVMTVSEPEVQQLKHLRCLYDTKQQQGIKSTIAVAESDQTGPFSILSDEIVLGIFKFLPRKQIAVCARVCKHWQRLVYDESLWRQVDLTGVVIREHFLGKILTRGVRVLRLAQAQVKSPCFDESLVEFPDVVPLSPESPSETLLRVWYMDATLCYFEGDSLLSLLMHSRRLKYLSLESCEVSSSVLRAISKCHFLEVLNLAMCRSVTSSGVTALVSGCKRLTQLNLGWTNLGKEAIQQIVQNLPELKQLNLSGCRDTFSDEAVEKLVTTCPDIKHLDLSDCIYLTARTLELLLQLKFLQHLCLSRCYSISPVSFSLCARMPSLRNLNVFGLLNAEGLEAIRKQLPGIAVNSSVFSNVARPVDTRFYRGKIWGLKCSA